jgi:hypothetical protein
VVLLLELVPPLLGGLGSAVIGALLGGSLGAALGFLGGLIVTNWRWREYLAIQDDGNDL